VNIVNALEHLESILASAPAPQQPGKVAVDLARHLGDPVGMEKARTVAVATMLAAEADATKVHAYLAPLQADAGSCPSGFGTARPPTSTRSGSRRGRRPGTPTLSH
jgi:hypothetical protein